MVMPVTYVEFKKKEIKISSIPLLHPYTFLESYRKHELYPTKQVDEQCHPSCPLALYQKLICSQI